MTLLSPSYFLFLLAVAAVFLPLRKANENASCWLLAGASVAFYATLSTWLALFLVVSMTLDWLALLRLARSPNRRWLAISLAVNFAPLAALKMALSWPESLGIAWTPLGSIIIPVGISFYTFKSTSYVIDVFRDPSCFDRRPARFFLFTSFFPALLAGPISRYPSFFSPTGPFRERAPQALKWIVQGIVKKACVADLLHAALEPTIHGRAPVPSSLAWAVILSLTVQIYADFSAYTDIARGSALLLGFRLPPNFRWSLLSTNILEFWQRHHVTLSQWLRDYLYFPLAARLGGGLAAALAASFVTFLASGLWHSLNGGALVFGASQGVLAVGYYLLCLKVRARLPSPLAWALTLAAVGSGILFLMSPSLERALQILRGAAGLSAASDVPNNGPALWALSLGFLFAHGAWRWLEGKRGRSPRFLLTALTPAFLTLLLCLAWLCSGQRQDFIYFRF